MTILYASGPLPYIVTLNYMKVTILGCGTSTGVPVPGCGCQVCNSQDPKNIRLRASILLQTSRGKNIIIDTSPDFRQQCLTHKLKHIDAVLYTHAHADHILGLDDLRSYNFCQRSPIPCYATATSWDGIKKTFLYVFEPDPEYKGGGLPQIEQHTFETFQELEICSETVSTFQLMHGDLEVIGFRFGDFAYATDCNHIPEKSLKALEGVKILILDGLRFEPHATHFTIEQALEVAKNLGIRRTILTHYTHSIDYNVVNPTLLERGAELAFDGMEIEF